MARNNSSARSSSFGGGAFDPTTTFSNGKVYSENMFRSPEEETSLITSMASSIPIIGGIFGSASKHYADQVDRQFQEYMARLGFDFTDKQRRAQNEYNYWVAKEFMNEQNQWNSYPNQVAEMRKAGLNPASIFGEGQLTGNNSSQAAPTASAAGGSASGLGYQSQYKNSSMSDMADFASAIKSISDAKLTDQQRADLLATATDRYNEIKENADKSKYERQLAGMNAWLLSEYGSKMKEADIRHMNALSDNLLAAAGLAVAQTGTEQEKQKKEMHEAWQAYMDWLERNKMYEAKEKLNYWYQTVENDIEQQDANITKTQKEGKAIDAQAGYYAEQSRDLRDTRAARINSMNADARYKDSLSAINDYDLDTRPNKISASWHNFTNMCLETIGHRSSTQILSKELELIYQEIVRAKNNNDYFLVNQLMDNAKDIAIALGSAAIAYKTGKDAMGSKPRPIGFNR